MSKLYFFISLLFLINLQANIFCEDEPEKITINFNDTITLDSENSFTKSYILEFSEEQLEEGSILEISTDPSNYAIPAYIYCSFSNEKPSADSREFSSQTLGKNIIYINSSKMKGHEQLFINIHSSKETNAEIFVLQKNEIHISEKQKKINFKLSDISKVYFSDYSDIKSSKILFYSLGENKDYFKMTVKYQDEEKAEDDFIISQKFENGYGIIIDLNQKKILDSGKFEISLEPNENYKEKKVEVGFDFVDNSIDNLINVDILEHVHGGAENGETCYKIRDLNYQKNINMLINAFSQDITFTMKKDGEKIYSLDIFNNYFIKFPKYPSESYYEDSYFCLKKFTPKEKETEELGPISYDFQIYYEDELSEIQSSIMPLINGKVYTHSINSGDIFIYRHNSFNGLDAEKIYSANLLTIRGKPQMYGYSCETYPDCNLDKQKFEELKKNGKLDIIKPFNQYIINKKKDALGNIEVDTNGEPLSDLRKQYLTIIRCESSEDYPNNGECKYALEINNELDEIQLAPEIVFATSVISKENDFVIKISDYNNIEYLKITFTVLTGNAEISLPNEKDYEFRHVHRKEIIKITKFEKEYYPIKITVTEPAFIELKYETDFYFRGYTMMNPNEINIEYLNKENGAVPLEIQNPDYFYPIDNEKNNDFYFTIKPLDCAMDYTYNFIDFLNITSIHHEVNSSDINFGSSYAFNLRISEYFHTSDNKEDCAMIIYTGEKSENIPLLLISDMPHPSNFSETYYLYPFIYNSDFRGIFVDFKFDYESLTKLEKSPLAEITFKIGNQEEGLQKFNIKKDNTFYISKEDAGKYCNNNLQCSLTIQIKKIYQKDESEISYIIKTNVYSSKISPEYIYNNKIYNYKLLPNDSKYLYTQLNNNEEGEINLLFNRGNPKIFAKIVAKNKIEENHNWNGRIKLPEKDDKDLLPYDSIKGIIKYSTKNDCQNGCELYIHIKSDEKTGDEDFSEVSLSVNAKTKPNIDGLPLNKYIQGNLPEKGEHKYYNIIIPEDFKKISINLYSPYGKALIKYNNIPSNGESDWELNTINSFGRLVIKCDDDRIKKDSLKGVSLTIGITNNDNLPEGELDLNYYLEIQGLYANEKEYYDLTGERSIICNTQNENYCYALLYLNHYNDNKNNLISALPLSSFDKVNIYANFYTTEEIEKNSYTDSIQKLFPTKEEHAQTSENEQFLLLDSKKFKEESDNYALLTIDCGKKNTLMKLVLSEGDGNDLLLPYNTDKILSLNNNEKNLLIENDANNYVLNINNIKGTSTLSIGNENYEIDGSHYIEFKQDNGLKINSKEKSVLLVNYEKENSNKVYELSEKTQIEFPVSGEKFPQYAYYVINNIPSDITKKINISFKDIKYKEKKESDDLFDVIGYILSEQEFQSIQINPKKEKKEEKKISPSKNNDEYIFDIKSNQITDNANNYIFVEISKNEKNINNYEKIKTVFEINEKKEKNKDDDDDDDGNGWIIVLIIIILICAILLIILFLYKKRRLSTMKKTEEEVNQIDDTPLRQSE